MCGIAGFIGKGFREIIPLLTAAQQHRGPDDEGFFFENTLELSLGHKRLSIIDLTHGHQPFCNEDESVALVFNGEIFNADPLRKELERAGRTFRTDHSDTEVILRLYEAHGIDMLGRLNGMFSVAIYDRKKKKVFGARDRFGIKPFYYTTTCGCFAFSSEVKALLAIPFLSGNIRRKAISHYLSFQCIPAPESIYEEIYKLPAATYFEFDVVSKAFQLNRYWAPSFENKVYGERELLDQIRSRVEESVKRWSISDVPLGCSLSGGLDSSIITMLATRNNGNLKTFTLGFEGFEDIDERTYSRKVAEICGTEHCEFVINEKDMARDLPSMVHCLDEPYGGGIPSWFIYKEMSKQLKVCLTGTGGDELFGNYGKWKPYSTRRDYLYTLRTNLSRLSLGDLVRYPQGCYYYKYFTEKEKEAILIDRGNPSSSALVQELWDSFGATTPKDAVVSVDVQLQLPEEFLMMTDRFSMNFSMEARTPFLDTELSSFVYSVSSEIRSLDTDPKNLLRRAFAEMLPGEITGNPKRGFVLPLDSWMKTFFKKDIDELFDREYLKRQGIFKPELSDRVHRYFQTNYGTDKVWTLLMFQFWYRHAFGVIS